MDGIYTKKADNASNCSRKWIKNINKTLLQRHVLYNQEICSENVTGLHYGQTLKQSFQKKFSDS